MFTKRVSSYLLGRQSSVILSKMKSTLLTNTLVCKVSAAGNGMSVSDEAQLKRDIEATKAEIAALKKNLNNLDKEGQEFKYLIILLQRLDTLEQRFERQQAKEWSSRGLSPDDFNVELIVNKKVFNSYNPFPSAIDSNYLDALLDAKLISIPGTETVQAVILGDTQSGSGSDKIASNVIFVRNFYDKLFKLIRGTFRSVLIGNPGVGKSMFHYYYLARIMKPSLFGSSEELPPDRLGCVRPPSVVIRQEGERQMTVYDINGRKAVMVDDGKMNLLRCFDPKTSLYLMEPGSSYVEPHFADDIFIPTLTTVSPNERRYKEFCKNGARKIYMPPYKEDELLAIGAYLLDNNFLPENLVELYAPKEIQKRFRKFGGIYRHVLPTSADQLIEANNDMAIAINTCNVSAVMRISDVEHKDVSHYILQYIVNEDTFANEGMKFTCDYVRQQLDAKLRRVEISDIVVALRKNDEFPMHMAANCSKWFEQLIWMRLQEGLKWHRRAADTSVGSAGETVWESFEMKCLKVVYKIVEYNKMKPNVLYVSQSEGFPFVEAAMKDSAGVLFGFQATRQQENAKPYKDSTIQDFMSRVKIHDLSKFRFVLIPRPSRANTCYLQLKTDNSEYQQKYEVWKVPSNYGFSGEEVPMSTVEEVPMSTVEKVPMSTVEKVPMSTVEKVHMSTVEEVPMSTADDLMALNYRDLQKVAKKLNVQNRTRSRRKLLVDVFEKLGFAEEAK